MQVPLLRNEEKKTPIRTRNHDGHFQTQWGFGENQENGFTVVSRKLNNSSPNKIPAGKKNPGSKIKTPTDSAI
ncbi:hypothetical protein TNCT_227541 [Trichonephila clavata]|uniref:Uncharacterized protein n=1 Tax=Trichonephila clavata TaxID=2740835 RepID=A0A8X6F159_TRICU|nr:hypothetical protein TNCT_227541 [Trichonephila clavata]